MSTWRSSISVISTTNATLTVSSPDSDCPFDEVVYELVGRWHPSLGGTFKITDNVPLKYGFQCIICVAPKEPPEET